MALYVAELYGAFHICATTSASNAEKHVSYSSGVFDDRETAEDALTDCQRMVRHNRWNITAYRITGDKPTDYQKIHLFTWTGSPSAGIAEAQKDTRGRALFSFEAAPADGWINA